jgi:hypothetical protein
MVTTSLVSSPQISANQYGGLLQWVQNKTAATSIKGQALTFGSSPRGVIRVPAGTPNCVGVWENAGVPADGWGWMCYSGPAKVLFTLSAATVGLMARTLLAGDAGGASGGVSEDTIPATPFASPGHWCEIGHIMETIAAPGLALVNLHFN